MSMELVVRAFRTKMKSPSEKLVLLALAEHAWDDGSHCFPSVRRLAEYSALSERSVQYALRRFEKDGWLELVAAATRYTPNVYRLSVDKLADLQHSRGATVSPMVESGVQPCHPSGVQPTAGRGATDDIRGATTAPEPGSMKQPVREPGSKEGVRVVLSDDQFLAALRHNPAYNGINIGTELAKMDAWLMTPQARHRKKTRRFIVAWLNRIDVAMAPSDQRQPVLSPMNQRNVEAGLRFLERHRNET